MTIRPLDPWLPHGIRQKGTLINTVVLHATAGSTLSGAVSTLRSKGLSYHFLIEKNGQIWKGAPISARAFHAGVSVGPQGQGVNRYSIGISFVNLNDGKDPYTLLQEKAVRWLIPLLKSQMDEYKWLTTHAIVSPGRKTDPKGFDVDKLADDLGLSVWRP